jgi:enoyl-CoA hydratase/carnithine racemase
MPEVDIKLPFSPGTLLNSDFALTRIQCRNLIVIFGIFLFTATIGMSRILTEKLVDPQVIRDVMFFGKRYTSKEAFAAKIVDELVPADRVVARATEIVQNLAAKASDRATLKTIKEGVYRHLLPLLKEGPTPENHPAARKLAKM